MRKAGVRDTPKNDRDYSPYKYQVINFSGDVIHNTNDLNDANEYWKTYCKAKMALGIKDA